MNSNVKTPAQTFSILILAGVAFILFSVALGFDPQPVATAQEPVGDAPAEEDATPTPGVNPSTATPTQPASSGVDMAISQQTNATTVTVGSSVIYTITIANLGGTASNERLIIFRDIPPKQLLNPSWEFDHDAIPNLNVQPPLKEWYLNFDASGVPAGWTTTITLTGVLISEQSCPAVNEVEVSMFTSGMENNYANNLSEATIGLIGPSPCTGPAYLPLIIRQPSPTPTPTPTIDQTATAAAQETATAQAQATQDAIATATALANANQATATAAAIATATAAARATATARAEPDIIYETDFEEDDWATGRDNNDRCDSYYENGQYWIEAEPSSSGTECWRPAPRDAEFEEGVVEAEMYHSEGESDAGYGLYMNGRGGDNFYLFRIWPNRPNCDEGGDWHLYRREDGDGEFVESGECHPAIERGFGRSNANVLRMEHDRDGDISVFVNGTLLDRYEDDDPLDGEGVGLYVRTQDDTDDGRDVLVKFNYFRVYELD